MRTLHDLVEDIPYSPWTFWVCIAILGVGIFIIVDWLDLEPASQLHDCTRSHTNLIPIIHSSCSGKICTTYTTLVPVTYCDEYGPWYPNPRHAEWEKRQREKELRKK